jgi:hypothetical protein
VVVVATGVLATGTPFNVTTSTPGHCFQIHEKKSTMPVSFPKKLKNLELGTSSVLVRRRRFELARTEFPGAAATAAARTTLKANFIWLLIIALFPSELDDGGNNFRFSQY